MTRVLEIQPNCSQALVARAKCHQEAGDLQAALRDLTTAINIKPGDRTLLAWRADINFKIQSKNVAKNRSLSGINDSHDSSSGVSSNLEIAE